MQHLIRVLAIMPALALGACGSGMSDHRVELVDGSFHETITTHDKGGIGPNTATVMQYYCPVVGMANGKPIFECTPIDAHGFGGSGPLDTVPAALAGAAGVVGAAAVLRPPRFDSHDQTTVSPQATASPSATASPTVTATGGTATATANPTASSSSASSSTSSAGAYWQALRNRAPNGVSYGHAPHW